MFYSIIQRKRNEWLSRIDCPVKSLLSYIEGKGMMRDAQIEAIKTYLFLKIECGNKPLWRLFTEGDFLSLKLDNMSLTAKARLVLETNKAAASLYEYACQSDEQGNVSAPALKKYIEENPDTIDYVSVFKKFFYDVAYPDYIFSLPMGAGKTYLMAAFIYLDLYFSLNEPDNPSFAHNFMILAPSGLKSSIIPSIKKYTTPLQAIFDTITEFRDGIRILKGEYNQMQVRANVRRAFIPHRSIDVKEEVIPETTELLQIKNFQSTIEVNDTSKYFPNQEQVLKIVDADKGKKHLKAEIQTTIDTLKALGNQEQTIQALLGSPDSYAPTDSNINDKTYHYLPYKFDSSFEISYFSDSLQAIIRDKQLEFYFNGDDNLTDFKIRCYKKHSKNWSLLGNYTPDFLVISRDEQGAIKQILIIETKGEGFAAKFAERRKFMEEEFVKLNNERFGYNRVSFLYIEDTMSPAEQDKKTLTAINQFFK